jgi:MFS family permease
MVMTTTTARTISSRDRILVAGLFLAVSMSAFEITAVLTALPSIVSELNGERFYGATLAVYLLASLISVVASGELADRRGPSLPFALGVGLFLAGLLVAGTAQSPLIVVLGRAMQGMGAGAQTTLTYVVIRRAIHEEVQPKIYAVMSAAWVLPSLIAPLIAGWITDTFGWRWVFLGLTVPAALVGILVVSQTREIGRPDAPAVRSRLPMALALSFGAAAVLAGSTNRNLSLALPLGIGGLGVCVVAIRSLLPVGTYSLRTGLPSAVASRFLATFAFGCVDSFVPFAAKNIHGVRSAAVQGFMIIGAALTWTAGQAYAAKRAGDMNPSKYVRLGFGFLGLGALLTSSVVAPQVPLWAIFLSWMVGGLGMGLLYNPTTVVAMSASSDGDAGLVGGQLSMADSLGFAGAATLGGTFIAIADRTALNLRDALFLTFSVAIATCFIGLVASRKVTLSAAQSS